MSPPRLLALEEEFEGSWGRGGDTGECRSLAPALAAAPVRLGLAGWGARRRVALKYLHLS